CAVHSFPTRRSSDLSDTPLHPSYYSELTGGVYDYTIISPWKTSVGLTKFFSRGLLSADLEYINYSSIKYRESAGGADYSFENQQNLAIQNLYRGTFNFKVGGEFLFTDRLAARAGMHLLGSPYKGAEEMDYIASAGLGYVSTNSIYEDLTAQQYKAINYNHHAYPMGSWDSPIPTAEVKNNRTNDVLTLGAKCQTHSKTNNDPAAWPDLFFMYSVRELGILLRSSTNKQVIIFMFFHHDCLPNFDITIKCNSIIPDPLDFSFSTWTHHGPRNPILMN